jgi:flagellar basal body-associated protein FliL
VKFGNLSNDSEIGELKMADDEETKNQEDSSPESSDKKESGSGLLAWIIMAVVILLLAGAGFGIGRLLAGSKEPDEAVSSQQDESTAAQEAIDLSSDEPTKTWYYPMDPVVANLNEPSVMRYVRATIVLEISGEVDQNKGTTFIDEKEPLLTNWLTIFLAGQTIEDIRGDRNLRRVQSQILDTFNEKLFPNTKPQIKQVLFKEFAIQ